ncbi:MAG: hypothetical protein NVS3B7_09440 [Candidatus Elarobacter sp.]
MRVTAHLQRGQMLPFWTLTIAATLTLLFFLTNYANTVRWQIRAQNAADSAASAGLATDANMYNEYTTLQFAAAVEETRMRYLLQAIVNTISDPAGCGSSCDAYYSKLVAAYAVATANYGKVVNSMAKAQTYAPGGLKNGADKAVALASSNCTTFDCAFTYTTKINGIAESVDVAACKKVPFFAPTMLGQTAGSSFTALGRSVAVLSPLGETFVPGSVNPTTGTPYQPDESPAGANVSPEYGVTFKYLSTKLTWYVAGTVRPPALAAGYGCS